ncbi:MAG: hypothetical protein R3A79_07760 [Nannocystaceae bacterium]
MRAITVVFTIVTLLQIGLVEALAAPPPGHAPPAEALEACADATEGDTCGFVGPHGTLEGTCRLPPGAEALACVPKGPPPPPSAAFDACDGASEGASCSFSGPDGAVEGSCVAPPHGEGLVCAPTKHP